MIGLLNKGLRNVWLRVVVPKSEKYLSNIWLRVVLSFIIAYLFLVGLSVLEQRITETSLEKNKTETSLEKKTTEAEQVCLTEDSVHKCFAKQLLLVCKVDNLEGFALLFGASLYMLEGLERRKRIIYEAWQIVDNAAGSGVATSHARLTYSRRQIRDYGGGFSQSDS